MGANSGVKGVAVAILSGTITAVPIYALLPVAGVLLKKGCRISKRAAFPMHKRQYPHSFTPF